MMKSSNKMCDDERFSVRTSATVLVVDRNLDYKELKDLLMEKIDLLPFCLVIHYSVFVVLCILMKMVSCLPGLFDLSLVIRQIYV